MKMCKNCGKGAKKNSSETCIKGVTKRDEERVKNNLQEEEYISSLIDFFRGKRT